VKTLLLHLGAVLIGLSKVGFGGGVGAVATPLLATVFSPGEALGLTLPLLLATDLMALVLYRGQWDRRRAAALLPGTLIGIALAAPVLRVLPPSALARVIGVLALVSVLAPMRRRKLAAADPSPATHAFGAGTRPPRNGEGGTLSLSTLTLMSRSKGATRQSATSGSEATFSLVGFLAGLLAGFTSTLAHLGGMLVALYLLPLRLSNATFVATASLVYCAMNTAKLIPYVGADLITRATIVQDLWLMPSLAAGVGLGFLLNRRLNGESFGAVVRAVAIVTSIKLLLQGG
jgi:uncharacterized membrane protein YfcA